MSIVFPASINPEIRASQKTMVEAWAYAGQWFVDPSMNGLDWNMALKDALAGTYKAKDGSEVLDAARNLLARLDDPYTKLLSPAAGNSFKAQMDGKLVGLGLGFESESSGDELRVGYLVPDSPAERAGVLVGDLLTAVDGRRVNAQSRESILSQLKEENSAKVTLQLLRPGGDPQPMPSGLASASGDGSSSGVVAGGAASTQDIEVVVEPQGMEISPVQYALLQDDDGNNAVGYVRVVAFAENTTPELDAALADLLGNRAGGVILDLRDNPGGVASAGVELLSRFLREGSVVCFSKDRTLEEERVALQGAVDGLPQRSLELPMVVLANRGTASTSELVTAALQGNGRATVIGEHTFGKGRTQRVLDLSDGSVLLVSTTTFLSPSHQTLDKVGLDPDRVCVPESTGTEFWTAGERESVSLREDPCINMAVMSLARG